MISTITMFGLTINIICSFKYLYTAHNIFSCLAFAVTFLPVALLLIQALQCHIPCGNKILNKNYCTVGISKWQ